MKFRKSFLLCAILTILCVNSANAQGLGSLFGNSTLGNLVEGVFTSSNIKIKDMAGEWTSDGPAVCFQGDNFLKKAGGIAAAAAVESKLSPYWDQLGLNNSTLKVTSEGKFNMTLKALKLSGTITRDESAQPGVFEFNFTILGKRIAGVTAYVQKTSKTMDVMFDATKLKNVVSVVASVTGLKIAKAVSGILDSYDGLAVGSHYTLTKADESTSNSSGLSLGNILSGLSKGSSQNSGTTSTTEAESIETIETPAESQHTETQQTQSTGNAISTLRNILTGGK
ncbi:MAG: DUF4923 family protein [Muribaculaceae bacterium]|nr:DUF4923 family protein [Muribaculaceae bacterium]